MIVTEEMTSELAFPRKHMISVNDAGLYLVTLRMCNDKDKCSGEREEKCSKTNINSKEKGMLTIYEAVDN